jgi:glutaminyl-peptide cyclotransferase
MRHADYWRIVACGLVLLSTGYILVGCGATASPTEASPAVFDGEEALGYVERQMAFGPRPTGSEELQGAGDDILETLSATGWATEVQSFEYRGVQARNLIGRSGNTGRPVFVLGAHYDTRRRADQDRLSPEKPVPGANDGASGVAVLLELAKVLDLSKVEGDVWLVFFDAEDDGELDGWNWIVGSGYFADHLTVPIAYAVVVDMIGDADQNIYYESSSDEVLREGIWKTAASLGYGDYLVPEVRYSMLDDHTPFLARGIPAVDIIDFDYPFWHTTDDTADKVSAASLEHVGRTLQVFLEDGGGYPAGTPDG